MEKVDIKRFEQFEPIKEPLSEDPRGHGFSGSIGCPTEVDVERGIETIDREIAKMCSSIMDAIKEARRRNIKANAVMINDELYYSRLCSTEGGIFLDVPMICGLRVLLSKDELPEDTLYSVSYAPHLGPSEREELEQLRQENEELRAFKERVMSVLQEETYE